MRVVLVTLSMAALVWQMRPSYVRESRTCGVQDAVSECISSKCAPTRATTTDVRHAGGVCGRVARALEQDQQTALLILRRLYELCPGLREAWAYDIARECARWARNTGVRWEVLVAIMWHESRFDPNAVSPTNDYGLMQIHGRRIFDVGENIRHGAAHFAGCLAAAGGNERVALGHYNGGSRCVLSYADAVLRVANGGMGG